MGFFSGMGFFEKVAVIISLPVLVPIAAAAVAYEEVTGKKVFSDSEKSNVQGEQDERERVERQEKEKRAAEEVIAIVAYAKKGVMTLQTSHASTVQPIEIPLHFTQLKAAVLSTEQPIEILGRWLPHLVESEAALAARQEILSLSTEIDELRRLRQAVIDLQPEDMIA